MHCSAEGMLGLKFSFGSIQHTVRLALREEGALFTSYKDPVHVLSQCLWSASTQRQGASLYSIHQNRAASQF